MVCRWRGHGEQGSGERFQRKIKMKGTTPAQMDLNEAAYFDQDNLLMSPLRRTLELPTHSMAARQIYRGVAATRRNLFAGARDGWRRGEADVLEKPGSQNVNHNTDGFETEAPIKTNPTSNCRPYTGCQQGRSSSQIYYKGHSESHNIRRYSTCGQIGGDLPDYPALPVRLDPVKIVAATSLEPFDIKIDLRYKKKQLLLQQIEKDQKVVAKVISMDDLKAAYEEHVRSFLISSGVLIEEPPKSDYMKALYKKRSSSKYLTTLDVMLRLSTIDNVGWGHFLSYLRDNRVFVLLDWENSLGSIESMVHESGMNLPMEDDDDLFIGECDAGFKNNIATISLIIWRNGVVWDCVIYEIPLGSNIEAELVAMYLLQRLAIDKKIKNFAVKTDCQQVAAVLGETGKINPEMHQELCMLMRSLKRYFRRFYCDWEPREKLHFSDSLGKLYKIYNAKGEPIPHSAVQKMWGHNMKGHPLYRIHQSEDVLKSHFGLSTVKGQGAKTGECAKTGETTKRSEPPIALEVFREYKIEAGSDNDKLQAICNLSMNAEYFDMMVTVPDEAFAKSLKNKLSGTVSKDMSIRVSDCSAELFIGDINVPRSIKTKRMDVLYDSSLAKVFKSKNETLLVHLLSKDEMATSLLPEFKPEVGIYLTTPKMKLQSAQQGASTRLR